MSETENPFDWIEGDKGNIEMGCAEKFTISAFLDDLEFGVERPGFLDGLEDGDEVSGSCSYCVDGLNHVQQRGAFRKNDQVSLLAGIIH